MALMVNEAPARLKPPVAAGAGRGRWPGSWPEREALLERQHQILGDRIAELILVLLCGAEEADAPSELDCGNTHLLRQLRLHLRLEERWLSACGCLCPGHRAIHQLVARDAEAGLKQAGSDRLQQLIWLRGLQAWLLEHTDGPDTHAYALARSITDSQP